jgi:predicted ATPase/DNA-binding SARP family transcriptional activator
MPRMTSTLQLMLLGPVRLERQGEPVRGFQSRKAVAVLGYLALRQAPAPRDHLVDLFWPDLSGPRGRANLSVVLHNLSSLLPGCFEADRHAIGFRPTSGLWVDALAFEALVAGGGPRQLAEAVALYRDELMAGLFLDDGPDFELWLVSQREAWRARVVGALATLMADAAGRGRFAEGAAWAARLLEVEPWHEAAQQQRMWLLACAGQRTAALAQYEACRRALDEALGVAPSAATEALVARIRAGEVEARVAAGTRPLASPHPHNLPLQLTAFLGREAELATVAERLANPGCRLLTLVGPGGTGKSRLALEAAAAQLPAFPDGVFLVPLAAIGDGENLPSALADAVGLALDGQATPWDQVRAGLGERQVLLVLDNFEQLLDGAERLLDLLRAAPRLKVLVTSRERLNFHAEWLVQVQGLPYPFNGTAEAEHDHPAVALFAERASHVDADFVLDEATRPHVATICRLVEGLPLAIELASAWAGDLPCERIAAEIARSLDLLTTSLRDVPPRHRSLRVVFESSWGRLAPDEQRCLAALSVFRGGFGAEAAHEVAGASAATLTRLTARQLVRQAATGRHELHPLVRHYAGEKLRSRATATARRRHAAFCRRLVTGADLGLQGPEQQAWLERLANEQDNLRAALGWCAAPGRTDLGLGIAGEMWRFWLIRGLVGEGRDWLARLLAADADGQDSVARARALNSAGILADLQGDFAAAAALFTASLAIHRRLGDERSVASVLNNLAVVHDSRGELAEARPLYEECLVLRRRLGPPREVAISLNNLGLLHLELDELDAARRMFEESLAIKRDLDDRRGQAVTLSNLGLLAGRQNDPGRASRCLAECLDLLVALDDRAMGAEALLQLAGVLTAAGHAAQGARILGSQAAQRGALGVPVAPADLAQLEATVQAARSALGGAAYEAEWATGYRLPWADAVSAARSAAAAVAAG